MSPPDEILKSEPQKEIFTPEPIKDVIEETITQRRVNAHALRVQKRTEKIAKIAADAF